MGISWEYQWGFSITMGISMGIYHINGDFPWEYQWGFSS
jgi:hypothetical protein